ncbi:unnamed protein product [Callosobruchus maculatus]|uniref:Uncharacterized protein n=1 Tax=Callosobruchus maculatus TaxID=64391 RepID=A0A653CYG2_CALMS|nr:unnamed protein product [Callosobruchus maculatus]
MQFENIARMNNWSNEEKACVLTSMLRDSAAAILENLCSSDLRDTQDNDCTKVTLWRRALNRAVTWSTAQPDTASQRGSDHVCI